METRERSKTPIFIIAGILVTTVLAYLSLDVDQQKKPVQPLQPGLDNLPNPTEISPPITDGYDCAPIPKGSWLTQELRKRGAPGIDPGPYAVIHLDGEVQRFPTFSDLPNLVYPNEIFCIKETELQSFNFNPGIKRGVIFLASTRNDFRQLDQQSNNIQAQIRATQGF